MLAGMFAVVAVVLAALKRTKENLEATVSQRTAKLREEVAERRRAEEQLRQANAELQRTQMQLIEAAKMETVGRMAAGVAHEVKNPLMTLSMGADYFLQRKPANDDEAALLQDMKEAVRRASNIINLMLDFSKPHPLQLAAEDLNAIIETSLNLVRHQLLQQRVNVVRQLQPGLPPVPLDRTRMEHVFVNLITNAAQAMPGGGTLTVRTAFHEASATAARRTAADHGGHRGHRPGHPGGAFVQGVRAVLHDQAPRPGNRAGIGHCSQDRADSRRHRYPRQPARGRGSRHIDIQPQTERTTMKKTRILVIDDEASVTRGIRLNLEMLGTYEVRAGKPRPSGRPDRARVQARPSIYWTS